MINNRYNIKKKLGSGRNHIYLCSDLFNPSKETLIKILPYTASKKELEAFRNEFFLWKKMNHPNIVSAYDYGTILRIENEDLFGTEISEGSKFYTVDYIEGETLAEYNGGSDLINLHEIIKQICSVLYYLHQSNYIYYNLNLESIIIQNRGGYPHLYLHDFKLTKFIPNNQPYEVQGMPHYTAPEILQINKVDHRADLYSLGIILYHLLYNRFPFDTDDELSIYKANIENDFEFPEKENYDKLISVTKNLLQKAPKDRYNNTLQILDELSIPITGSMKNSWKPAKYFAGRKKELYDINSIIYNKNGHDVAVIRGGEGSGKSLFLEELNYTHINSVLIKSSDIASNNSAWEVLLRKVFYMESIYKNIDNNIKSEIRDLLFADRTDLTEKLKSLFMRISRTNKFLILLDDFNSYDELSVELLKEIIPILQVSDVKVVLAEDTGKSILSDFIRNLVVFQLRPFSNEELNEFLEKSFYEPFPKSELNNLIRDNCDMQPGNIYRLIDNMIYLGLLQVNSRNVKICIETQSYELLTKIKNHVYKLKIEGLTDDELEVVNICAMLNINLDVNTISIIAGFTQKETDDIIFSLIGKEIFSCDNIGGNPQFTSAGLKSYTYNNIHSKKALHLQIAEKIIKLIPDFNKIEIGRQYELSGEYKKCFNILMDELQSVSAKSNKSYQKKLLARIATFPLEKIDFLEINYLLSGVLFELKEIPACIDLTNKLLEENIESEKITRLMIQKGKCLISLRKYEEGISLLNSVLSRVKDEDTKQSIFIEIAQASLDLGNFTEAARLCMNAIDEKECSEVSKARAFSMISSIEQMKKNNLAGAIYNLQSAISKYHNANMLNYVVLLEINIGNIIYRMGNLVEAERHWHAAFKTNERIGNLSNEANILFNYGLFCFNTQMYKKAIEQYQRAESIFACLGDDIGRGLALSKLGEVYLNICEYDLALKNLELAEKIFNSIDNEKNAGVLFLLGHCYFYLGDNENLEVFIHLYEKSAQNNELMEKHKYNLAYLKNLLLFCQGKFSDVICEIEEVKNYYKKQTNQESHLYFSKSTILQIKSLIYEKQYDAAMIMLNEKTFIDMCNINSVLRAEREYLVGLISENNDDLKLNQESQFFTNALKLIENQFILELTWEISYALAMFYLVRGNYKSYTNFALLTKSLINYISGKISSKILRDRYLNSFNRKSVIDILEKNEKQV